MIFLPVDNQQHAAKAVTPSDFIAKWQGNSLSERAGAQAYFLDLCDVIGVEKPCDPENNCFAWENKAPGKDLSTALKQLMSYALALDNPPLLVVSDREMLQIHTRFTGTPSETHTPFDCKTSARRITSKSCDGCSVSQSASGQHGPRWR